MIVGFSGALQLDSGSCSGLATGTLCWDKCLHEGLLWLAILILPELFDIFLAFHHKRTLILSHKAALEAEFPLKSHF